MGQRAAAHFLILLGCGYRADASLISKRRGGSSTESRKINGAFGRTLFRRHPDKVEMTGFLSMAFNEALSHRWKPRTATSPTISRLLIAFGL